MQPDKIKLVHVSANPQHRAGCKTAKTQARHMTERLIWSSRWCFIRAWNQTKARERCKWPLKSRKPGISSDMRCGGRKTACVVLVAGQMRVCTGVYVFVCVCETHSNTASHASSAEFCCTVNMWRSWRKIRARAGGRWRCAAALSHARTTVSLSLSPFLSLGSFLCAALSHESYPGNRITDKDRCSGVTQNKVVQYN